MNLAPDGSLDYEDERVTPEDIREAEAYDASRGFERWTLAAQHRASGELAGFTEVRWHADNPTLLNQGDTVVHPKHGRRGLGRWLKAHIIDLVLNERKQVTRIRTENAYSNDAIVKINEELGYQPTKSQTEWQIETARAKKYLAIT